VQKILLVSSFPFYAPPGPAAASDYLVNGDFEQTLDVGWVDTANVEART